MNKITLIIIWIVALMLPDNSVLAQGLPITSCVSGAENINANYTKQRRIQESLDLIVTQGVPGVSMALYSSEGWWTGTAGYAKLETKTQMQSCHLLYLQSVAKTYMAVAILKLYELGKIDLEKPISSYLPANITRYISHAETITVKMLLNHTSGVPEYNLIPAYITKLLQEPDHYFEPIDYLKYIDGKPPTFEPGSKFSYRNTNYVILSLIADQLTGDHAQFITDTIFKPLGLVQTYYRGAAGYLNYPELVNAYWDRHSDGIIENASILQRNNVLALVGDDGIVTTPIEAVKFLRGLLEGKLLAEPTVNLMKTWVNDGNGNPTYGLGLDHSELVGHFGYGHSGGGIGAGCQLYYFPENDLYIFIGINLGTVTDSPIHKKAVGTLDQIYKILLE